MTPLDVDVAARPGVSGMARAFAARRAADRRRPGQRRDLALVAFGALQILSLILLQKLGFPLGGTVAPIIVPLMYAGLAGLLFFAPPKVDFVRIALFTVFVAAAAYSTVKQTGVYSSNSLILVFTIYVLMLVRIDITEAGFKKILSVFSDMMIVIGAVEIIQLISQVVFGLDWFPKMDKLVSADYLVPGYVYIQPVLYGLAYNKPNAFVFLEVSFLAQFLAIALAIELLYFRRTWRLAFYAIAVLVTFAGTGLLLILVCLPLLIGRVTLRTMFIVVIVGTILYLVAVQVGWYDMVHMRFFEYRQENSSSNHRFIQPYLALLNYPRNAPDFFLVGIGPGNINQGVDVVWWPFTKTAIEYGYLSAILFYAFVIYSMFRDSPSRRLSFLLLVWYSFMGSLASPVYPLGCILFSTMFRLTGERARPVRGAPA